MQVEVKELTKEEVCAIIQIGGKKMGENNDRNREAERESLRQLNNPQKRSKKWIVAIVTVIISILAVASIVMFIPICEQLTPVSKPTLVLTSAPTPTPTIIMAEGTRVIMNQGTTIDIQWTSKVIEVTKIKESSFRKETQTLSAKTEGTWIEIGKDALQIRWNDKTYKRYKFCESGAYGEFTINDSDYEIFEVNFEN